MKKLFTIVAAILAIAGVLTGCGADFDASGYVKACLDANVHGEYAAYAEITKTEESVIQSQHDAVIEQEMAMLDVFNIDDATKDKFRELFLTVYDSCKYEVGEAAKNDDGTFTVPVTVYKLKAFGNLAEDAQVYVQDYYEQEMEAGNDPSQDELYAKIVDYMYEKLSENVKKLEYGDPEVRNVKVEPTASNSRVYQIETNELQDLMYALTDAMEQ